MNKKTLMRLPVIGLMVALFCVAVLAASPVPEGIKVTDKDGNDITKMFEVYDMGKYSLANLCSSTDSTDEVQAKITAVDKDLKIADFENVVSYWIEPKAAYTPIQNFGDAPYTVQILNEIGANEVGIIIHDGANGMEVNVFKGKAIPTAVVDDFSPFLVYKAAAKQSPQTGAYATPYILMISVALVSCGAIFAIRAKKATK